MKIYLVGKNIYITALTDEAIKNVVLSFMVFDDNQVPQNHMFEQTESLTQNLMGITEYGMLTFNSNNSDMEAEVTIRARLNDDVVEKTLKVSEIMETAEGREIGTGGGGGTVYNAGWGINIVDDEISADRSVVASTEYVDNGLLVLKGEIETELADKQDKPENGFVAHYQTTTAQEIIEYLDRVGDNNSQVVIERGNDFYGCVLVSKQGDNKVVLRTLGSNMGKYYIYTYTITNEVWASNSYGFQELLNSGVNIKTINGETLLGSGDIEIGGDNVFIFTLSSATESGFFDSLLEAVRSKKIIILDDNTLIGGTYKICVHASTSFAPSTQSYHIDLNFYESLWSNEEQKYKARIEILKINTNSTKFIVSYIDVQESLVSGQNIKTINGESILGSGDIEISASNEFVLDGETVIGSYKDENNVEYTVYRKVVDVGNLPNTTSKTVAHGLAGVVKEFLSIRGVAKSSNNNLPLPSCSVDPTAENNIYLGVGPNNITITTGKDRSSFNGKVILEYIKNT